MKKIFFPILLLLCLTACKEDLTDYYDRLLLREKANDSLKNVNNELQNQIDA
jgi:type III secretory pathway lipoprotein EscJ